MTKKLCTDSDWCIWCGVCVAIAPELFKFNEKGKAYTSWQPKNENDWQDAEEAIKSCPVEVIYKEDE